VPNKTEKTMGVLLAAGKEEGLNHGLRFERYS